MIYRSTQDEKASRLSELHFARQELVDLQLYRRFCLDQDQRAKLRRVARIEDRDLEGHLLAEGFHGDNVLALEVFPIAKTAWASGGVSLGEEKEAHNFVANLEFSDSEQATELFAEWLTEPPSDRLWPLWEQLARARSDSLSREEYQERCRKILLACRKVAMASGGLWGIGRISPAEQRVLHRVQRVFESLK